MIIVMLLPFFFGVTWLVALFIASRILPDKDPVDGDDE